MQHLMDLRKARAKAKRLLGSHGYAARDAAVSSKALRNIARTNALSIQATLSAGKSQQHTRATLELVLTKERWLSEYYRYKVGVLDTDLGIPLFTVLAHADSWETCFQKIKKLVLHNQFLAPSREDPDESDPAAPDPDAPVPDSE